MVTKKINSGFRSRTKSLRFHYSFLKILSGSDLSRRRLPYMQARSQRRGPTVWLTACCHGDEVGGIVVVQEVFRYLRKTPLLNGSLHAFPIMNPLGFEAGARHVTLSGEDLNRSFPGSATGTLAERMADKIFSTITATGPAIVLDLHNDWVRSIPYTVLDPPLCDSAKSLSGQLATLAPKTGLPVVVEQNPLRKTLSYSLIQDGVASLTIELGESHVVNEDNVKLGVRSVCNILADLGMIPAITEPFRDPLTDQISSKILRYSSDPVSSTSGIIRFLVGPGESVSCGQTIAKIYNAFGRLQEALVVPHDAIVLGHVDSSVAYPGAPIMAFGIL